MNVPQFLRVLRHGWWIIVAATLIACSATLVHSHKENARYKADATVLVHPTRLVTRPADYAATLDLLSNGSLIQTLTALAQSRMLVAQAAHGIHLGADQASEYAGNLLPAEPPVVLTITVEGPDAGTTVTLAGRMATVLSAAAEHYFPAIALTPLDMPTIQTTRVQPLTTKNVLYGGLVGVLIGFILAVIFCDARGVPGGRPAPEDRFSPDSVTRSGSPAQSGTPTTIEQQRSDTAAPAQFSPSPFPAWS